MRATLLFLVLMGALIGCARAPRQTCALSVTKDVSFLHDQAHDTVTVHALGPSCDKAVGLFVVAAEDGQPIWSWTAPLPRAFGEDFHHADDEQVGAFLARWAEVRLARTSAAPGWPLDAAESSTLDQATYDDIRARDLPMLCHLTSVGRETCVFWEPAAAGADMFLERDYIEGGSPP